MQNHEENLASRVNGSLQPLLGVTVTVKTPTGLLATIYNDDGVTVQPNPMFTNANGLYGFRAANGPYKLTFSGPQIESYERDIDLYDPDEEPPLTQAQAALPSAASRVGFQADGLGAQGRTIENKLRERISIEDFGGSGDWDGSTGTDNLLAMQKAIASGSKSILLGTKNYYFSAGITIPDSVSVEGGCMLPGAAPIGARMVFAEATPICVTLTAGDLKTASLKRVVVDRIGTPPANSEGVRVYRAYNAVLEDVFCTNHARLYSFYAYTTAGLGAFMTNCFGAKASEDYFYIDSWPELRVAGGRFGSNGTDYAGANSFVRIKGTSPASIGIGPNTLCFENVQFNQGVAGPKYWIDFDNVGTPGGNQVFYKFSHCHVENITDAYVHAAGAATKPARLTLMACDLNTAVPMFDLPATLEINEWKIAGSHVAASTFAPNVNYINSLALSANSFVNTAAIFNAPPTNNHVVSSVGNTWGGSSSVLVSGSGWSEGVFLDAFGNGASFSDTSGSSKVLSLHAAKNAARQWTPVLAIGGSTAGITYAGASGVYQLVGRVLTLDFKVQLSSKGAATGAVTIGGLPFAPAGVALDGHSGTCGYVQNCALTGAMTVRVKDTTALELRQSSATGNSAITEAGLANNSVIYGSLSYFI